MLTSGDNELARRALPGAVPSPRSPRGEEFRWRFRSSVATQRLPELGWARTRAVVRAGARGRLTALAAAAAIGAWLLTRINWSSTPDGDPALHLKLIKDIAATGELPTVLPNFAARISESGRIEALFPYSYTPLYHLAGAALYAIAGVGGVLALNVVGAACVSYVIARFVARRAPWAFALLAAAAAFVSPHVQSTFNGVYMEPMMLGLFFPAAWFSYIAMTTRRPGPAMLAGLLLGLSVATRQVSLFYCAVLASVVGLALVERRAWRRPARELPWMAAICFGAVLTAAPSLLVLARTTGSIGYGDMALPGSSPALSIDDIANTYIAGITKPDLTVFAWVGRYQDVLLYADRWSPTALAVVPLTLFVIGVTHLHARGGASRFYARWVLAQVAAELLLFVALHGNARYIVLSQMLFYSVVPVGVYIVADAALRASRGLRRQRVFALAGIGVVSAALLVALFPRGYVDEYVQSRDRALRSFRGEAYADMGEWVNANTADDAVILTPRAYTAELTWERTVTWVTFYGNAWIVDAISTPDEALAADMLVRHGVDYVLITDPPGTYIDRIPPDGMRAYLTLGNSDLRYFTLVHVTNDRGEPIGAGGVTERSLRLYRVEAPRVTR